jgi:MFS transporter, FHS family, L-fucose permease
MKETTTQLSKPTDTRFAFALVTCLFFLWGFAHNLDPILIPHLKKSFTLTTTQSTLVDSAVFIAYFLIALPAGFVMRKYGYKSGIIIGLLLFATGAFCFIPAADHGSYDLFLMALFVIACGLTFLETAANPYAAVLGPEETSTNRLNFAQSFNGLAAALAPVIGARLILTKGFTDEQLANMSENVRRAALAGEAASVKMPYLTLGLVLIVIAVIFAFTKLPSIKQEDQGEGVKNITHAFRHKHLTWGVIAQFFYVGGQVCVFSLFILYATSAASITEVKAADYLGACGIAFLIGRFAGTFLMRYIASNRLLALYGAINTALCIIAVFAHGMIAVYTIVLICFFMSVMFPTIFALGIKRLGPDTEYGSSLLIMSIVGGAILPRVFGIVADASGNIQLGYFVPMFCFLVVAFFGWHGYRIAEPLKASVL